MMLTETQKDELARLLRPVAPPRELDNVYSQDQLRRLLGVVRSSGPHKLIIAQHFASAEELIATSAGGVPQGVTPTLDMFLSPTFRNFYGNHATCLFPEINDCFYNDKFLELAKSYWGARYARPQMMLFNVNGPCFTYWPEGPRAAPKRVKPPIYNRGVVVQNEMMVHRGEANGPVEQQFPAGLDFHSVFAGAPDSREHWIVKTGDAEIARYHTDELRFLVHWSAEVYEDFAELKKNMDHTEDLTFDQVFDTLIQDVRSKGIPVETPTDPLHDPLFIRTLNSAYDIGRPTTYPPEAPVTRFRTAA